MSHRAEPRSGRGCFGAVVVVPFLALGGMFALIAFTGGAGETPLAAPPPSVRPTSSWWTEPFETGVSLATVTETVVAEGAAREVRAARMTTQTRVVGGTTVTETVRASPAKPAVTERNEPPEPEGSEEEPVPPPVVTTTSVVMSTVETSPPPVDETPVVTTPPDTSEVPPSTPRAEDPPVGTPAEPACDRSEPGPADEAEVPVVPAEVS